MRKLNAVTAALLATTAFATPVLAAEKPDANARQIELLQQQLRTMQQQLDAMKAEQDRAKSQHDTELKEKMAAEAEAREAQLQAGAKIVFRDGKQVLLPPPPSARVIEPSNKRLQLSSGDGAWTIAPTGRVHFDIGTYLKQAPETAQTIGDGRTAKLTSGVNVRRARVGITGKALTDFNYSLILDAGGATDGFAAINQAMVSYAGIANTSIDFGYFAQYGLMEEAMSSNDILFIERATPVTMASSFGAGDPRFGVGVRKWAPNWFLAAYITGSTPNTTHQQTQRNWNFLGRASYNIVQKDTATLHVGGTVITTLNVPDSGPGTARSLTFSDRPELRIDPTSFINTGALGTVANPVTSAQIYAAELAGTYGPLFFQSEYIRTVVNRTGRAKLNFDGGYAQASYAWGGRRTYSAACGCYGSINPIEPFSVRTGGMGAFEVAARISYAEMTDLYNSSLVTAAQTPGFVNGGRQTVYTAGLNWFWNANMMWKFNYIHTSFNRATATTTVGGAGIPAGIEIDAIAARLQFVF